MTKRFSGFSPITFSLLISIIATTTTPGFAGQWETRVFNEKCPTEKTGPAADAIAPILIALGTFLIPKLIDYGLSFANQHLQEKKAEEVAKNNDRFADGIGAVEAFYEDREDSGKPVTRPVLHGQCLVVVRGDFGPSLTAPSDTAKCAIFKDSGLEGKDSCDWLRKAGVNEIGIYLEAKYMFSADGLSFRLQPSHFSFIKPIKAADPAAPDDGSGGAYDLSFTTTYESPSSGQATASFAGTVLVFESLKPKEVFRQSVLAGKSTAWTPTMPPIASHTAELQKIGALYDNKKDADGKVKAIPAQIALSEKNVREATVILNDLLKGAPLPAPVDALKEGLALANKTIAGETFDDVIFTANLDGDPATNLTGSQAAEAPKKQIARRRAIRENQALRAKANELKEMAEAGLKLRSDLEQAKKDFETMKKQAETWAAKVHPSGPVNVKVNMKEKPHLPTNIFLLTAADAFANSKAEISQFVSSNVLQTLNFQDKNVEAQKISDQATLIIAANGALNTARTAEAELNSLPADTAEQTKRDKTNAFENAKISANVAALKACLPAPYPGSYGGNLTVHAC